MPFVFSLGSLSLVSPPWTSNVGVGIEGTDFKKLVTWIQDIYDTKSPPPAGDRGCPVVSHTLSSRSTSKRSFRLPLTDMCKSELGAASKKM